MSGRVLVVDDNRAMAETIRDILMLQGWTCEVAYSGEEALERAAAKPPKVVLMDIKMEGMNGVEALRALRRDHPHLKVILMTAYSTATLVEEARAEGVVDVLNKPIDPRSVTTLLGRVTRDRARVLILEDNPVFLKTLSSAISQSGFSVARAASLEEALTALEGDAETVVLLDLVLPDCEPEDCVAAIRRANPSSLFILYSGYPAALERAMDRVPDAWVRGCLRKPFQIESLVKILDDLHPVIP